MKIIERNLVRVRNGLRNQVNDDRRVWHKENLTKVLIRCSPNFQKEKWIKNFHTNFPDASGKFEIQYAEQQYQYELFFNEAEIVFAFFMTKDALQSSPHLKLAYFPQSGLDFLNGAERTDSRVITPVGLVSTSIAEHVLALTFCLMRKFNQTFKYQFHMKWSQQSLLGERLDLIREKTIAVLGVGNNGKEVARLFHCLGSRVLGYDIYQESPEFIHAWYGPDELSSMLSQSDVIVLTLPLTAVTTRLINREAFSQMKPSAYLVNVGRGELIDEDALYTALKTRQIRGAALDVLQKESLPPSHKLWRLDNIVITPHIAGNINNFVDEIQIDFIKKLKSYRS